MIVTMVLPDEEMCEGEERNEHLVKLERIKAVARIRLRQLMRIFSREQVREVYRMFREFVRLMEMSRIQEALRFGVAVVRFEQELLQGQAVST